MWYSFNNTKQTTNSYSIEPRILFDGVINNNCTLISDMISVQQTVLFASIEEKSSNYGRILKF